MAMNKLFIVDYRLNEQALERLRTIGEVVLFRHNTVKGALSGHPDIAMFFNGDTLIIAADIPEFVPAALEKHGIKFLQSDRLSGAGHPDTATFNASGNHELLIHNTRYTCSHILNLYKNKKILRVRQGYSRCSTLLLNSNNIITSDEGIFRKAVNKGIAALLVATETIELPGLPYGLIGGCCGMNQNKIYLSGSLDFHPQGKEIRAFMEQNGFVVHELSEQPLTDVGGIFCFESKQ